MPFQLFHLPLHPVIPPKSSSCYSCDGRFLSYTLSSAWGNLCHPGPHFSRLRSQLKCHLLLETLEPPRLDYFSSMCSPSTLCSSLKHHNLQSHNCAIIGPSLSGMRPPSEECPLTTLLTTMWGCPVCDIENAHEDVLNN